MKTLDGKEIANISTVAIRTEAHPLKANANIYRAYKIDEDGSLFSLFIGRETVEEVKAEVIRHLSHKTLLFCEI